MGLKQSDESIHKQALYLELLLEANNNISLTGIKKPKEAVIKHTIDSLSVSSAIEGKKIVDIGSGGQHQEYHWRSQTQIKNSI